MNRLSQAHVKSLPADVALPTYDRAKLRAGDKLSGPAIITEMDSTALVLPGCVATVDALGNILITLA